jgi:ribosome-associated protein
VTARRTKVKKAPRVTRPRPPRKTRPVAPPPEEASEQSRAIALSAARAALEKKAQAVEIVDVMGKVDYADYLVLMTGQSDRHVKALADAVEEELAREGTRAIAVEGLPGGNWVLIDFVDVVVHVFQRDARSVYDLDGLWMDATRVPVPGESTPES